MAPGTQKLTLSRRKTFTTTPIENKFTFEWEDIKEQHDETRKAINKRRHSRIKTPKSLSRLNTSTKTPLQERFEEKFRSLLLQDIELPVPQPNKKIHNMEKLQLDEFAQKLDQSLALAKENNQLLKELLALTDKDR